MAKPTWQVQMQIPATFSFTLDVEGCEDAGQAKEVMIKQLNESNIKELVITKNNIDGLGEFQIYPGSTPEMSEPGYSADKVPFQISKIATKST